MDWLIKIKVWFAEILGHVSVATETIDDVLDKVEDVVEDAEEILEDIEEAVSKED